MFSLFSILKFASFPVAGTTKSYLKVVLPGAIMVSCTPEASLGWVGENNPQQHFSPLDQINSENVKDLGSVREYDAGLDLCYMDIGNSTFHPILVRSPRDGDSLFPASVFITAPCCHLQYGRRTRYPFTSQHTMINTSVPQETERKIYRKLRAICHVDLLIVNGTAGFSNSTGKEEAEAIHHYPLNQQVQLYRKQTEMRDK